MEDTMKSRVGVILDRATSVSMGLLAKSKPMIADFLTKRKLDPNALCFAATGSVGRYEALEASDFDVIPIARDRKRLKRYEPYDQELRQLLKNSLDVSVSKGVDLTRRVALAAR